MKRFNSNKTLNNIYYNNSYYSSSASSSASISGNDSSRSQSPLSQPSNNLNNSNGSITPPLTPNGRIRKSTQERRKRQKVLNKLSRMVVGKSTKFQKKDQTTVCSQLEILQVNFLIN